ncbi:MAG: hypothetical protein H6741_01825 [Alphaproteobacteria bacterium]|nr:hypothetical protein [Alphaproteobacteria bacterium]MCB9791441.1 hypothetical protein [Alphaproteobacteria bacterium]
MTSPTLFAVAPPGLEHVVADELETLLGRQAHPQPGGARVDGDLVDAAGLCLWSRTAARVLVELGEVPAASLQQLRAQAGRLDWTALLHRDQPVTVRASVRQARFKRADAVEENVSRAISDAMRSAPRPRGKRRSLPPAEIRVRVEGRAALLSLDAAGLLHRRGYRLASGKAPIRENLAAACLRAVGWQPGVPLVDPMCGSGTFLIEAALEAADRAPGLERPPPAVTACPSFREGAWERMIQLAREAVEAPEGVFLGGDRAPGALDAARGNAERAGVLAALRLSRKDATEPFPESPAGPGLVLFNPPYGHRVAENVKLAPLYQRVGDALAAQFPGWRLAAVCPDAALAGRLARKPEVLAEFSNGGIGVKLFVGELGR